MCGIIGFTGTGNAVNILTVGLTELEYRGYDSAGISVFERNAIKTIKARGKVSCLKDKITKEAGCPVLSAVNVKGSTLARESDYVFYTHAGPEIAVASTKAYTVQLAFLYLFAFRLAKGFVLYWPGPGLCPVLRKLH